ncbi:MAG: hypothetical protein AAF639_24535 [Chloroflexota bacterium]
MLFGQEATLVDLSKKTEFGLNVTRTLAGFFNSGGEDGPVDPFLLMFKCAGDRQAIRIGVDLEIQTNSEFSFSGEREDIEQAYGLKLGKEWRTVLGRRIDFYWGLDIIGTYSSEKLNFNNAQPIFDQKIKSYGVGGGPFAGIYFHITPRFSLMTEATLYGLYVSSRETFLRVPNTGGALLPEEKTTNAFELSPVPPNSLYVYFRF